MGVIAMPEASSDMPETLRMQNLSRAYVYAIAAKAGINIYESRTDLGIDMTFSKVGRRKERQRKEDIETTNTSAKRIFIPKIQIFTVESLTRLVDEVQLKVQR
jgi:hypothetical protein